MDPSSQAAASRRWRIGDFVFDARSGELRREEGSNEEVRRLAPQPAQLLALLAEHAGDLVSHRAIRRRLWRDVTVDFEQGLHFSVRQVRAALGDDAGRPAYVENLPRRGYRLMAPVTALEGAAVPSATAEPAPASEGTPEAAAEPPASRSGRRAMAVAGTVALGALAVLAALALMRAAPAADGAEADLPSLAIMPFAPPEDGGDDARTDSLGLAERLLLRLADAGASRLAVVGPTTTGAYASDMRSVARMARELNVDHVLNGRWIVRREGVPPELVAELIRSSDGAHTWVEAFPRLDDLDSVADRIADGVASTLALR